MLRVPTKPHLESRIKKFQPHFTGHRHCPGRHCCHRVRLHRTPGHVTNPIRRLRTVSQRSSANGHGWQLSVLVYARVGSSFPVPCVWQVCGCSCGQQLSPRQLGVCMCSCGNQECARAFDAACHFLVFVTCKKIYCLSTSLSAGAIATWSICQRRRVYTHVGVTLASVAVACICMSGLGVARRGRQETRGEKED